ncbi:MAG: 30S ribosomal protein S7 [Candidatus Portnoybacteria bacterium CG10_big_fil_rev_8_21_14_0_10_44_7]|uniref:Small ribosomal subunit protein uS7 n=1 Tax=Candidatus Portnoybacteria bacterium CG10_big_fil_rev_8_21_14_0_10_44_7 TaxID=1974816 RepID=A0A2M8KIT2_9BACT|nr:MAG: 30S ribosomal protein S7 [Candidatus Portnoybacteria bacterium CG10_big_fil_rev_8_21_14_0_10_44_7]
MRRKRNYQRNILPDPKYQNVLVAKFINQLMNDGKKEVAKKILYDALALIEKQKKDPLEIFDRAIKNVSPALEVKSRRIGGANYQVPREVRGERKITLAFRWLIAAARGKKGMPMAKRLADELALAAKNEGAAVKKREDTHRMAEANKAFAHFSW